MKLDELVVKNKYKIHPPNHEIIVVRYLGLIKYDFISPKRERLTFVCEVSKETWYYPMMDEVPVEKLSSLEDALW
jgi:hypothetical protein